MSKEVVAKIKLEIVAGQASPAPPVGPALGQHGANIMEFVRQFNDRTGKMEEGTVVPVLISIFKDKKFSFVVKTPPASYLLKKAAGIAKGSGAPNKDKVGKVTMKQIEEIARIKLHDLNAYDVESAKKIIAGTARNMGLEIVSE
jgi:large subunit ribosomal protein L11